MSLDVKVIRNGELRVNTSVVYDLAKKQCVIIDPSDANDVQQILDFVDNNNLDVLAILATHGHFDHVGAVDLFRQKYGCKFFMSSDDLFWLTEQGKNYTMQLNVPDFIVPENIDVDLKTVSGADLPFGIKVIFTPGHTAGGVSFYLEDIKTLISGDTLFFESVGRTDLYGASFDSIKSSIVNKLFLLPDDVRVIPGHGIETTIGHEKAYNPFVR